ncbi:hypothetical protein [Nocardia sp. NPDC004750]
MRNSTHWIPTVEGDRLGRVTYALRYADKRGPLKMLDRLVSALCLFDVPQTGKCDWPFVEVVPVHTRWRERRDGMTAASPGRRLFSTGGVLRRVGASRMAGVSFSGRWDKVIRHLRQRMGSLGPGLGTAASRPTREAGRAVGKATDDIVGADSELGHGIHRQTGGLGIGTGSRHPVSAGGAVTDLSHMPLVGALVDAAHAGEMGPVELTRAFAGLERRYGPFRLANLKARHELSSTQDGKTLPERISLLAHVRDDAGTHAGIVIYEFWRDKDGLLVATNELTQLHKNFTGKGFSTAFSAATEAYFRRCGVDRIEVHASLDDGGYAWAKAGYDWNPAMLEWSKELIQDRIDTLIGDEVVSSAADTAVLEGIKQRFDGPVVGFPSPQELALLTGDDPQLGRTLMRGSNWYGMKKL